MVFKFVIGTALISLLAGCPASVASNSASTSPTVGPLESPVPAETSATPMASHRVSDSPEQALLAPDGIAEVVTPDLVMRTEPGVETPSEILPYLLQPGDQIFIVDGPVHATQYDWYHVQPIKEADLLGTGWPPAGWVAAASRQGEPWIAARMTSCTRSDDLELAELAELHPLEALVCFRHRTLRVRASDMICPGYLSGAPAIPNYTIEPTWLGSGQGCAFHAADGTTVYEAAAPFFSPGILDEVPPSWVSLSGQFDHPAASSCLLERQPGDPLMPAAPDLDDLQVVLLCRSHFAVTAAVAATPPNE